MPIVRPEASVDATEPAPRAKAARRPGWGLDLALLTLFPFIQLGISYYASLAMLAAVLVVVRLRAQLAAGAVRRIWLPLVLLLMFLSLTQSSSGDPMQDLLRVGREAIFAGLYILLLTGSSVRPLAIREQVVRRYLAIAVILISAMTLMQYLALSRGIYIGLPDSAYAVSGGTIPGQADLYYSHIRPNATFSEPSYLAFFLLSALLMVCAMFEQNRRGFLVALCILLCGAWSQAASFIVFGPVLVLAMLVRSVKGVAKIWMIVLGGLLVATLLILGHEAGLFARIEAGTSSSGDSSIFDRVFGPLQVLPAYLGSHLAGTVAAALPDTLQPYAAPLGSDPSQFMMNGATNLFFEYGVFGLPILLLMLWRNDFVVNFYIVASLTMNGSPLAPDKLAIVCFSVAVYDAVRAGGVRMAARRLRPVPLRRPLRSAPEPG